MPVRSELYRSSTAVPETTTRSVVVEPASVVAGAGAVSAGPAPLNFRFTSAVWLSVVKMPDFVLV